MDLFVKQKEEIRFKNASLSLKMRPESLNDFVGQEHILGEGKLLKSIILNDRIGSIILFGPPGCGKTALARVISNTTCSKFEKINAVTSNLQELRKIISLADERLLERVKTMLFIDEIHRFNKAQQDVLLPEIEEGTISLIGTTTLNPYFAINSAIISRSRVFQLQRLSKKEVISIMQRALTDTKKGLGNRKVRAEDKALEFIAEVSDGDARFALDSLETGVNLTEENDLGEVVITLGVAQVVMQKKPFNYDRNGEEHYDTISAFVKSLRGSDPDAGLYWLAKMIYGGEDLRFIARRIVICAAEDVGNADPQALVVAQAAAQAADFVGLPEAQIILAQAALYVACAPKSNAAYLGIKRALTEVAKKETQRVPDHLKEAGFKGAKELKRGEGYKYPHNFKEHYVKQDYLAKQLKLYFPSGLGYEKVIKERMETWRKL